MFDSPAALSPHTRTYTHSNFISCAAKSLTRHTVEKFKPFNKAPLHPASNAAGLFGIRTEWGWGKCVVIRAA